MPQNKIDPVDVLEKVVKERKKVIIIKGDTYIGIPFGDAVKAMKKYLRLVKKTIKR